MVAVDKNQLTLLHCGEVVKSFTDSQTTTTVKLIRDRATFRDGK